jgi:polysaccharide export outer membrane protein
MTRSSSKRYSAIAGKSIASLQLFVRALARLRVLASVLAVLGCAAIAQPVRAQIGVQPTVQGGVQSGIQGSVQGGVTSGISPVQSATSSNTPLANQSMLYPGEDFTLSPGDLIAVRVFMQPDYQATVRIGLDGTVQLPFVGSVNLKGLSVREAQTHIADLLRTGLFYRNPEVTIQVLESLNGSVTIAGEVKQVVPITGARRLIDVLSAAGGLPANASHTVRIVRPGVPDPIVVNLGADLTHSADANMLVYPRDIIQIARAGVVYVLGAFHSQGAVPLDQATPLTLMQLAALSGGIGYEAKYDDLRLIRTDGNERKVVDLDIKKVIRGQAPDPVLQANDIVFLPTNWMKAALKNIGAGGVLGIVSVLIAAHAY